MILRNILIFFIVLSSFQVFGQKQKERENLSKRQTFYYDPGTKLHIESTGYYYKDDLGETTDRHGKWTFYDKKGFKVEERTYNRNKLDGETVRYYNGKQIRDLGYFKEDIQDSLYVAFTINGDTSEVGYYNLGTPIGQWRYFYDDGHLKSIEKIIDNTSYVWEFYASDSLHTQTLKDGNGEVTTYYSNGNLKSQHYYKDGLRHGEFKEGSVYGYDQLTGEFNQNKPTGEWREYFYSGDIEKISNYKDGMLDGDFMNYYDNGQVRVKGQYEAGGKVGEWAWFTNSGTIDMQGSFKKDLQHGSWVYNFPNGSVSYKAKFKNGLKDGKWTYYYRNGKKFKVGHFKDDLKDGNWTTWYEDGTLLMEGDYKKDKEEGLWKNYWENGSLKNQSTFKNGELHGEWISYYDNGTILTQGFYDHGLKVKEWVKFFPNGRMSDLTTFKVIKRKSKIKHGILKDRTETISIKNGKSVTYSQKDYAKTEEGKYKNDEKTGKWITYNPGGVLPTVISNYKNGRLNGKMQTFDIQGRIISEINYKNGVKHGAMKLFDKNGRITKQMKFDNGIQVIEGTKTGMQFSTGR